MTKTLNLEWTGSDFIFDPKRMAKDDPDRAKVVKAIQLLKKAEKLKMQAEALEAEAVVAIGPLALEVNFEPSGFFANEAPLTVPLNSDNSSVLLATNCGGLSMSYDVRFSMTTNSEVTEEAYENWLGDGGWDWVGIKFATDGYDGDNGSQMSYSIDVDE